MLKDRKVLREPPDLRVRQVLKVHWAIPAPPGRKVRKGTQVLRAPLDHRDLKVILEPSDQAAQRVRKDHKAIRGLADLKE